MILLYFIYIIDYFSGGITKMKNTIIHYYYYNYHY